MPDITRKTISATQAPSLWNGSPYVTRWMLWKCFHDNLDISSPPNDRMDWGLKLQPLIISQAASDLAMEIHPNADDSYHRRGLLGCTRDATIVCPDRGPGALETKCVFDYRTWMQDWGGGETIPRHYEIQLQVQMFVGDGERSFDWGVIAAWVAGEIHYFERQPILDLWGEMKDEAEEFFRSLAADEEPDPFGVPLEIPFLSRIEREPGKIVEVDDADMAALAREYSEAGETERAAKKIRDKAKAKLLAISDDADEVRLPGGVSVKIKTQTRGGYTVEPTTFATIKVHVPGDAMSSAELKSALKQSVEEGA